MISRNEAETEALVSQASDALQEAPTAFEAARKIVRLLGAHRHGNLCRIGFWAPELLENRVPDGDVFLEVLDAEEPLDLEVTRQQVRFRRQLRSGVADRRILLCRR